jgi:hypothetical protein
LELYDRSQQNISSLESINTLGNLLRRRRRRRRRRLLLVG